MLAQPTRRNAVRSNHQRYFIKKRVLKNCAKFACVNQKNACAMVYLFNKVAAFRLAKFLRTPFYRTPLDDFFCAV